MSFSVCPDDSLSIVGLRRAQEPPEPRARSRWPQTPRRWMRLKMASEYLFEERGVSRCCNEWPDWGADVGRPRALPPAIPVPQPEPG